MHQFLARCSAPVSLVHAPSWADFITAMVGFKVFGTHSCLAEGRGRVDATIVSQTKSRLAVSLQSSSRGGTPPALLRRRPYQRSKRACGLGEKSSPNDW